MIELRQLTKRFGTHTAVDSISLEVPKGQVLGFLGPNGAGKSTTMRMATGFLPPTSGSASLCGHDVQSQALAARRRLGYLPEGAPAWPEMTPEGLLEFCGRARGYRGRDLRDRAERAIELVHLEAVRRQPFETLSKGFKRRVGLAQAILHDPDVLILDEPTDGLDPNQKHEVRELIRSMAADKAVILSTHILEEVESVCTRAVIISSGQLRADGKPEELIARSPRHGAVRVSFLGDAPADAGDELRRLNGVREVEGLSEGGTLVALPRAGEPLIGQVAQLARDRSWPVREMQVESGRLETVFRSITESDVGANGSLAASTPSPTAQTPEQEGVTS